MGTWDKSNEKWKAQIYKDKKPFYGGYFDDELDAAKGVNQLCEKLGISRKNPDIHGKPIHGPKTKSSKYFGVSWNTNHKKWIAQIVKNGKQFCGGRFDDELDAAKGVNQLCEKLRISPKNPDIHGEPSHGLKTKSSKYFGVTWSTNHKKWKAQIYKNGKQFCGGYFDDELDAAKGVNQLCEKLEILPKNPDITGKPINGPKTKSSKYFGVSWNQKDGKWHAQITKGGKSFYGGYFDDELDAAKGVNQLCEKLGILPKNPDIHGEPSHESKQKPQTMLE